MPASQTLSPPTAADDTRQRIMVVEDNPGDADLTVERLVETAGVSFDVRHVSTLQDALALLLDTRADAIILDLNLPDSRGLTTLHRIKEAAAEAPVIVLTGIVDQILKVRALDGGADDVLSKDSPDDAALSRSVLQVMERARIRAQHMQLQRLLDTTPDAIIVVNFNGVVRYVNHAAFALFGRSGEQLLGEVLGFSVQDGQPADIVIQGSGIERQCEMRVVPMAWNLEACYLATIRDVTERKQAELLHARSAELELENRRIALANRLKTEFMANMSHELRTPLNAIIGFADLLRDGLVTPESPKYKPFLDHIGNSGKHLLQLIDDILDLSKVEAGKIEFRPEPVDLAALIAEVVDAVSALSAQRIVSVQAEAALRNIVLDSRRFKQVLYNYLSNALKFTPEGGLVTVRTRAEGPHHFRLEVEDSGMGIAPHDMGRLFVAFQQLEAVTTKRHKGTGLGLALTKRLVEAQGGSVGVRSVPGQGSVFHAVLPRRSLHEEPRDER